MFQNRIFKMSVLVSILLLAGLLTWQAGRQQKAQPQLSAAPHPESQAPENTPGDAAVPIAPAREDKPASITMPPRPAPLTLGRPESAEHRLLEAAEILQQQETVDGEGRTKRLSLTRAAFKYPLLRVIEALQKDPRSGELSLASRTSMVADHVIVKTKPGIKLDKLRALMARHGGLIRKQLLAQDTFLVAFEQPDLNTVPQAIERIGQEGDAVLYVEADYLVFTSDEIVPNDAQFGELWGLKNSGQNGGVVGADIKATQAWSRWTGSRDFKVGVIDTGIEYTHEDLKDNIWTNPGEIAGNGVDDDANGFIDDVNGWNFASDNNNPMDGNFHGTHVSGTIGASANNAKGVAGVCWNVALIAIKGLSDSGSGATSDLADCVTYATRVGAKLTSNSWGGGGYSQVLRDAIADAATKNILFVAAAGNSSKNIDSTPDYPAAYDLANIICVAATDRRDQLASFSNYGATTVDLAAPGVEILSCALQGSYRLANGTSMACPHVAGAAAWAWSLHPEYSAVEVKASLLAAVDPVSSLQGLTLTGGRLNLSKIPLASQPWLGLSSYALKEDGTSFSIGNADGIVNPGETVGVLVSLRNVSSVPVSGISGTVSVAAAEGAVTVGEANFGNLPSLGTASSTFAVRLNAALLTPAVVALQLNVRESTGRSFSFQIPMTVHTSSRLAGLITHAGSGNPIAGARVEISGTAPVLSGADGRYQSVVLRDGSYALRVTHADFAMASRTVALPPSNLNVNFALEPLVPVSGRIVDGATLNPVSGARVMWFGPNESNGFASSDSNGLFALKAMQGTYLLAVNAQSYAYAYQYIPPLTASAKIVNFTLGRTDNAPTGGQYPLSRANRGNTGASPYVGPQSPALVWESDAVFANGGGYSSEAQILVTADGTLITLSQGGELPGPFGLKRRATVIAALNPLDGSVKWKFLEADLYMGGGTGLALGTDGTIYAVGVPVTELTSWPPAVRQRLYAIAPDGSLKWRSDLPQTFTQVFGCLQVGSDGAVYVGITENSATTTALCVFNPDGTRRLRFDLPNSRIAGLGHTLDGRLVVGTTSQSDFVKCVFTDGKVNWTSTYSDFSGPPCVTNDGQVHLSFYTNAFVSLDATTGQRQWRYGTANHRNEYVGLGVAVGHDHTAYVAVDEPTMGYLAALYPDGSTRWKTAVGGSAGAWFQGGFHLIGADGTIYTRVKATYTTGTTEYFVKAITANGVVKWSFPLKSRYGATHSLCPSMALAADGTFYALLTFRPTGTTVDQYRLIALRDSVPPPAPNLPPIAVASASAPSVQLNTALEFYGNASRDPDGQVVEWLWDFGDGTPKARLTSIGNGSHAFQDPGTYTVTLTVKDNRGMVDRTHLTVNVSGAVTSHTVTATEDTYVQRLNDLNYAEAPYDLLVGQNNPTYLKFDMRGVVDRSKLTRAILKLWCYSSSYSEYFSAEQWVYGITNDSWKMFALRAANAPNLDITTGNIRPAGSFLIQKRILWTPYPGLEQVEVDVTDFLKNRDSGDYASFILSGPIRPFGEYSVKGSKTGGAEQAPTLIIRTTEANSWPKAIAATPADVSTETPFALTGSSSSDADGTLVRWAWDLGDGTPLRDATATRGNLSHTYLKPGVYYPRLQVTDNSGAVCSQAARVRVQSTGPLMYTFIASEDTYVNGGNGTFKTGGDNYGNHPDYLTGMASDGTKRLDHKVGYKRFVLGGLNRSRIKTATIQTRVHNAGAWSADKTAYLRLFSIPTDSWSESTLTYNSAPFLDKLNLRPASQAVPLSLASVADGAHNIEAARTVCFDVTQNLIAGAGSSVDYMLHSEPGTLGSIGMYSKESAAHPQAIPMLLVELWPNEAPVLSSSPWADPAMVRLPGTTTVAVIAMDDGIPNPPGTLTYSWSKVSGPGSVTFASANSPETSAAFASPGQYVLRVAISDGELTSSGDVTVTVLPQITLTVTATDALATENSTTDTGRFTLTRSGDTSSAVSVHYSMSGTASNGVDYSALSGSATIPAGAVSTTVVLSTSNDTLAEGYETAVLTILPDSDYTLGTSASATVKITDDDQSVMTVGISDAWAAEPGSDIGRFIIYRSTPTATALTVNYTLTGSAINGIDYVSLPGTLTFAANAYYAYVVVTPRDDTLLENIETVTLNIAANSAYQVGTSSSATLKLLDNEMPAVSLSITDSIASEGSSDSASFRVTRIGGSSASALTVKYALAGTAQNGVDYALLSGSALIPAGASFTKVTVAPLNDTLAENIESVSLTLSADAAYQLSAAISGTITLYDDELPIISVTSSDASSSESGTDSGAITLTRSGNISSAVTVNYILSGTASQGVDFGTVPSSITLAAGVTSATIVIRPIDDTLAEGREYVQLFLSSNPSYQTKAPTYGLVYLYDDEKPELSLSVTDPTASEAAGDSATFTITRAATGTAPLTVYFTLSGTATNGSDYNAVATSATIPAGAASVTVTITPKEDALREGSESITLSLSANAAYSVFSGTRSIAINDND